MVLAFHSARFLNKITEAADQLPDGRRPSNLTTAREVLKRMKLEAELVGRAELLANDRFIKLHAIRDLCVKAQLFEVYNPLIEYVS